MRRRQRSTPAGEHRPVLLNEVLETLAPQPGEVVSPQPPGISIDMGSVQVADFDTLMVETDVPEQRLHMVTLGSPAEIVLDAFPARRYRGRTEEITPQVNRSKATVIVRVSFHANTRSRS